mgnify:CR=1 FL=1
MPATRTYAIRTGRVYTAVTVEVDPTIAAASSLVVVTVTLLLLIPMLVRRPRRAAR